MKCPNCQRIVKNESRFCSFCGTSIVNEIQNASSKDPPEKKNQEPEGKLKRFINKVLKVLFVLLLIMSLLSGSVLGYLVAKGKIDITALPFNKRLIWSEYAGSKLEGTTSEVIEDKKDEKIKTESETSSESSTKE